MQFVGEGEHQACAGGGEWMAKTDRSTVDIHLLNIDAEVVDAGHGLASKGFVNFPTIDVANAQPLLAQALARRKVQGRRP